jgi:hypothetical protein
MLLLRWVYDYVDYGYYKSYVSMARIEIASVQYNIGSFSRIIGHVSWDKIV